MRRPIVLTWLALMTVIGLPASLQAQRAEEIRYYHTDAVGSVRLVTDAAGQVVERYDYLPFGEPWPVSPSGTETRRFTGQERDTETGLDYFAARYYASNSGRFTQPDDPGYADLADPQTWNLYAYARNNPLRFVDPTGHAAECPPGSKANFCDEVTADYWGAMRFWWESFERSLSVTPVFHRMPVLGPPNPTCVAAARNTGIGIGGVVGGLVGATGGGFSGGVGGSTVAPGVGTLGGIYMGGTTGFGIGSAGGAVTGGFLGAAAGNILCASSVGSGGGGGWDTGTARVTFGHGSRHLAGTGLPRSEVEDAIARQVQEIARGASATGSFWGRVVVRGQEIVYRAFTRPDGTINIGTYTAGAP